MSKEREVNVQGGVNVLGLLGLVFVTLKLTGHITWSWWWVTAPFWGGLALGISIVILVLLGIITVKLWRRFK
jgi:hypothetical protein